MRTQKIGGVTKLCIAGIGATALIVGPLAGVANAAPNTIYVNNSAMSTDADCLAATDLTIQSAVDAAGDGDTIVVCPGTYPETVKDAGKVLNFRSLTRGGATVDGGGGSAFTLSGVRSSLDGFVLTGATSQTDTPAAFLQGEGESVTNSIFTGDSNAATILGSHVTFTDNTVQEPNQAFNDTGAGAAGFFFNSGGGDDSTVTGNTFVGDFEDAAVNIADQGVAADNLRISGNTVDTTAGGNFVVAGGTTGLSIVGNTVTGSSSSGTGILLLGEDSGYAITGNKISGRTGASAVSISSYGDGGVVNGGGDVSGNAFTGNLRGLNVFSASGTVTAHLNILVGNSEAAIKNTTSAFVTATNNFFGCNGGPGANGCDGIEGTVNDSPFLVLSTNVTNPSLAQGGTTTFTADLDHNNAGDVVNGHVLDSVENAAFSFSGGTVNPASAPITAGTASTTLTAGTTAGGFTATAMVANASSSKPVTVAGGSTGSGGKPSVRIIDTNTVEGNSGTHAISFPVRLSKAATVALTVRFQTADGSAKAGSDYIAKSGTLTIAKGQKSGVITVLVKGDKVKEPSETFFVTLSNARNGYIADPNASGIIKNDD